MRQRILVGVGMAAALLLGAVANAQAQGVKIRVAYGALPSVITPFLFLKTDHLKHYGRSYTVDSVYILATSVALQALAAKEIDVSYMSFSSLANAIIDGNIPMKVISDVSSWGSRGHQGPVYMVKADSPVKAPADLKGKVLATSAIGTGFHYAMTAWMRKGGLQEERDYTVVEARLPAMEAMLRDGKADLVTSLPPFLFAMEAKGGVRRLFTPEDAMGDVQSLVNVVRTEFLAQNKAALTDFMEDYLIALKWFLDPANHKDAVEIAAKFMKQPADRLDYAFTRKDFYRDPTATPDLAALQRNIDLMLELGVIKKKVDVKASVDLSVLEEAKRRVGAK